MSDVPEEIWLEVLSRLPVIDLLRFRCVSKQWKCLIDTNEFSRHHLNHSLNTNSNLNIILQSVDLYSANFDLLKETNRAHFQEIVYPLKTRLGNMQVLGSCQGLLALTTHPYYDTTILWNPYVRRFHELPCESLGNLDVNYVSYGFGYDVVSDDYKLVRMVQVWGNADIEVKVCSLKSDSWRRIPDFPYYLSGGPLSGEFANGALHWRVGKNVNSDTTSLLIAFDLGTEEYRLVPLPEFAVDDSLMKLFVLGGCLSLLFYFKDTATIWVMEEYGVQESWSFLFTFDDSDDFRVMKPIGYSKCNRKVLVGLKDKIFMWYDLDNKSTDFPMVQMPINWSYGMYTCLQSLVLLNNGTCDFDLVAKATKTQERKAKEMSSTRTGMIMRTSTSFVMKQKKTMKEAIKTVISP